MLCVCVVAVAERVGRTALVGHIAHRDCSFWERERCVGVGWVVKGWSVVPN